MKTALYRFGICSIAYEESNRRWYEAIGEFVGKFEHMCQEARIVITADLNRGSVRGGEV